MAMISPPLPQVVVPIVAMRAGTDYQTYVDLLVPGQAKISLLQVTFRWLNVSSGELPGL